MTDPQPVTFDSIGTPIYGWQLPTPHEASAARAEVRARLEEGHRVMNYPDEAQARLAVTLGYTQYQHYADTGENPKGMPLTEYVLPVQPFQFIGPYVITKQLVLDRTGASAWQRDGRQRIRARMQRTPS